MVLITACVCTPRHHALTQKPQPDTSMPTVPLTQRRKGSLHGAWTTVTGRELQTRCHPHDSHTLPLYLAVGRKQLLLQLLCHLAGYLPSLLQVLIFPEKRPEESCCVCMKTETELLRDHYSEVLQLQNHWRKPRTQSPLGNRAEHIDTDQQRVKYTASKRGGRRLRGMPCLRRGHAQDS